MNRQSQWLFEAPINFQATEYNHPYTSPELEDEWEDLAKHLQKTPVGRALAKMGAKIIIERAAQTPKQKPCKQIWTVWGFQKSRATLLGYQKQHIKDISKRILGLIKSDLKGKNKNAFVVLQFSYEGHVDGKTEPNDGKLDLGRAASVANELESQLVQQINKLGFQAFIMPDYSGAGSTRPYSSDSQKNRRVVICVRWEIKS
jgi:hypothetical protein